MKPYTKLCSSALLLILITLAGCAKKPIVNDLWIDEAYDGQQYGNVLVIGAAEKLTFRNIFEEEFVSQLRSIGINAIPSYHILPYNNMLTRELVLSAIEHSDIDSVLITSLIERSKMKVYYSSVDGSNPYSYYKRTYHVIRKPSNTASYDVDVLFLKTNLYDVKTEKLVWSITSESRFMYKIKSLKSAISLVISNLRKDGLM